MIQIRPFISSMVILLMISSQFSFAESGKDLYGTFCAACHGTVGEGDANWPNLNDMGDMTAPPHNLKGHTWRHSDKDLLGMITKGHRDPYNATEILTMPAYGDFLTSQQMLEIIGFVKLLWTQKQIDFQEKLNN